MTDTVKVAAAGLDVAYPLAEEQITCLHEKSWASVPGLLSTEDVTRLRDEILGAEVRTTVSGPDKPKADPNALLSHGGVAWKNDYVRRVVTSRRVSSAIVGLMKQPEALYVQDLSFFKPIGGGEIPYHQDYSYWPFDRKGNLSLWIALEDMEADMGPLRYLAGSHLQGPLGLIEKRDIRDAYPQLWDSEVVGGVALKAGDAQAHWGLTCHGSAGNTGNARRSAMAIRYHRSDVVYTGLTHPEFDLFNLTPGKKFSESKDFWRVGPDGLIEN